MEADRVKELGMYVAYLLFPPLSLKKIEKKPEPEKVLPAWSAEGNFISHNPRDAYRNIMSGKDGLGQNINTLQ